MGVIYDYENIIINATINPNKAIASVKAKPSMVKVNSASSISGLALNACIKLAKIVPIPIPAPPMEIVASPPPNNLQPITNTSQ